MDEKTQLACICARVSGLVQGVGYRYFCKRSAERLGISGYARNKSDGSVDVVGEGNKASLLCFLDELKTGPSFSRVASVDIRWESAKGEYASFRIK